MNDMLRDNILAFWLSRCIDKEGGGYFVHFDERGGRKRRSNRSVVAQARHLYLFSRTAFNDFGGVGLPPPDALLAAARHGFEYLRGRMWDEVHGGFFSAVSRGNASETKKDLYGQSFALLALSEYFRSSKDTGARELAVELVDVLDAQAHDRVHGGYGELFEEDWTAQPSGFKTLNSHLHLLEALTAFVSATASTLGMVRLAEVVDILIQAARHPGGAPWAASYDVNWRALPGPISYGHNVETVYLLVHACAALNRPVEPLLGILDRIWDTCLLYGYDRRAGALFADGPAGHPSADDAILWWPQADGLLSAIQMYALTGRQRYALIADRLWHLITTRFVDREYGEWRPFVGSGSPIPLDKGNNWKAGYHTGRSLVESMKLLRQLS